jgi:hypothetical protein
MPFLNSSPGEFFIEWEKVKLALRNIEGKKDHFHKIAGALINAMVARESKLFENEIFCAAVYLDPRSRLLFAVRRENEPVTDAALAARKEKAKQGLFNVFKRLEILNATPTSPTSSSAPPVASSAREGGGSSADEGEDELARIMEAASAYEAQGISQEEESVRTSLIADFEELGKLLEACLKKKSPKEKGFQSRSVFDVIKEFPQRLQDACNVVCALPASQASVERLFSCLKFHLTHLRNRLSDDSIDMLLFLHANDLV